MCVVSAVGDDWTNRLPKDYPWIFPDVIPTPPYPRSPPAPMSPPQIAFPEVSKQDFDKLKKEVAALKKDVERMKKELEAAKKQDEAEGNPDCEMEEKVALLKKVAELVGVDLSDIWPEGK